MPGTFKLNEEGMKFLLDRLHEGMERIGRTVSRSCRAEAPVRKREYRRREKTVSVKFSRLDEQEPLFTPKGRRNLVWAVPLSEKPKPIVNRFTGRERPAPEHRGRLVPATRFTLKAHLTARSRANAASRREVARRFGGLGAPTNRGLSFRLRQNKGAEGGALRKSIGPESIVKDGRKVSVVVRATAPYAWYVEVGFNHKGGGHIPGKGFMARGLANVERDLPRLLGGR